MILKVQKIEQKVLIFVIYSSIILYTDKKERNVIVCPPFNL